MNIENKVLVILGPTSSGKSDLAVDLAKKFNGEVISADSRQVYKGLDIGTGKVTKGEMKNIPHHLLDIVSPEKNFSVKKFQKLAKKKIAEIQERNHLPIICGGTGFYIQSIVQNIEILNINTDLELREKLEKQSVEKLYSKLKKLDSKRAKAIDKSNKRRIIRAIEIASQLGNVPKIKNLKTKNKFLQIGIQIEKNELRKRINTRIEKRLKKGLVTEAEILHKKGLSYRRMEELGLEYKHLSMYLRGKVTKNEMIKKIKIENWRYAKRQITWFKRDKKIGWFNLKEKTKILKTVNQFLNH
jgi:tRNA dimethylallyltransferase